jgi:hypothetical protein
MLLILSGPTLAAEKKASFGVSVTIVYNCAMDTKSLSPEARKILAASCAKQGNAASQQSTTRSGATRKK